jgi:DNA repair protein SbcC/Rad50
MHQCATLCAHHHLKQSTLMIPRTIQIQNFLSYGSPLQIIDFTPHHLICLSGKNGHGKSAILDAITWALWGQARKIANTTRPDQGLLRLGQSKMMVICDFELGNTVYRVKRVFEVVYEKPYLSLEFGICTDAEHFSPLTEKTVRDTQACIEKTVGLTFDTFVNSSFFRQGNANEFSKRSPKERKEIIVSILGLGTYDLLRKAAQEKIRNATSDKQILIALQTHRLEALQEWDAIQQEQTTLQHKLTTLHTQHTVALDATAALFIESTRMNQELQAREQQIREYETLGKTIQTKRDELRHAQAAWRATHAYALTIPQRSQYEKKRAEIAVQIGTFQQARHEQLLIKEQMVHAQGAAQTERRALEQEQHKQQQEASLQIERCRVEQENAQQRLGEILQQHEELKKKIHTANTSIEQIRAALAAQSVLSYNLAFATVRFEKRKAAYQRWATLGNFLRSQYALTTQKLSWQDVNNPSCPLCEQNLSAMRKRFLQAKFTQEADCINHKLERLKQCVPRLKELLVLEHAQLAEWQQKEAEQTAMQHTLDKELHAQQEVLHTHALLVNQKNILKTKQAHLEQELQKALHAMQTMPITEAVLALQQALQRTEQHIQELHTRLQVHSYNQHAHEQALEEQKKIDEILTSHKTVDAQQAAQQERKHTIHALCRTIKEARCTQAALEKVIHQSDSIDAQYKALKTREAERKADIAALTEQKEKLIHTKGILDAQQKKLTEIQREHTREQKKIETLDITIDDYTLIAHASSKDGIQALLIEDALPEIEQEANSLLAKLTNNNAQIMIESLRDLKKGGTKETLDIKISDAAGIRPYELFSGGEAFRIDFALRIAISKLLARRAGTALQTLIIDEGFGSQDEEGLSLIMDALYAIQEDFAKIIIVSHLAAMKDQFPVHFVVEKSAGSSIVTVVEQG